PRMDQTPIANTLDASEVDELFAIFRPEEDHNGTDLSDRFGENRRRQNRRTGRLMGKVALVQRDVLDSHNSLVHFELDDAVDEQEGIAVGENLLDCRVVEG